jgi:superfamily II DNA/RNA helicase
VSQFQVSVGREPHEKRDVLRQLLRGAKDLNNAIIFCNRKREVAVVYKSLQKHGFSVGALHGDMDQSARTAALDQFRKGEIPLLVASDVAARGLDIPAVSHVFNFDVPTHAEDYVHRIGRTGRAGRLGAAFTIVTRHDDKLVAAVEKLIGQAIAFDGPGLDALPPGEPREERRGRRDDKRPTGRGRERGRPERSTRPSEEREAPPVRQQREERPEPARSRAPTAVETPDAVRAEAHAHDGRRNRRREREEDDGPQVKGLGDHVPAFLLRPVRV